MIKIYGLTEKNSIDKSKTCVKMSQMNVCHKYSL